MACGPAHMKRTERSSKPFILGLAALLVASPGLIGGVLVGGDPDRRLKMDPGGAGGLPSASGPATLPGNHSAPIKTPTIGLVLDAITHQPIADALLVITTSTGEIAGLVLTDDNGVFVVYLLDVPGLELAIPSEGLAGLPIEAGGVFTVFVP